LSGLSPSLVDHTPSNRSSKPEGLSLARRQGLDPIPAPSLTLPVRRARQERHDVVICLPFAEFSDDLHFDDLVKSLGSRFGQGTQIRPIRRSPSEWVVERAAAPGESAIPALQTIDAAFQDVSHLPFLIEQADAEYAELARQIDESRDEMDRLVAEKQELAVGNAVLAEKLRAAREDAQRFGDGAARVRRDFDVFLQKFGPQATKQ
jgi:outer membrane murein-binding lipoprotein Lpp